ncbi:hypothetical protein G4960_13380 [Blautia obeum]|uniref:hypothetical protein n=1 Tax=Blautia obeum TaxID=40520 RepID=UPI00156EB688|nr:hypothetical protein [Blautia obeum]NSG40747.1 hypothetical protein [Blautia obeum]
MLDDLVAQEEKNLQVNSKEFNQRHEELMQMIRRAEGAENVNYMELVLNLVTANRERVREIYYLLLGFLGR